MRLALISVIAPAPVLATGAPGFACPPGHVARDAGSCRPR